MKKFLDKNFLLENKTAKTLFHKYAEKEFIFDFHNHLSAKEIYENNSLGNLANAWLDHDHYKWRAMRAQGISENIITGHLNTDGSCKSDEERGGKEAALKADFQRYLAFVKTIEGCIGNPLYHWTHLELQRYFGITKPLTQNNALSIWNECNEKLSNENFKPRGLLEMMNVKQLCTTDDPCDSLEFHKKLSKEWKECIVRPTFRPDNILNISNADFSSYIEKLEKCSDKKIASISDMIFALQERLIYFKDAGCVVSDHSIEDDFYEATSLSAANDAFEKTLKHKSLSLEEIKKYKTFVLIALGKMYSYHNIKMQLHIGALRDNNTTLLNERGKNIGIDSLSDFNYAAQIGKLLNDIYSKNFVDDFFISYFPSLNYECKPKIILYNLNPKDNEALATMSLNFRNCIFGPAWWFNDHKNGIEEQLKVFSRTNVLSKNIGMLTDSRSFLSFPRHEYYRRILCNYIGNLVENGEYPMNEKLLGEIVKNISYSNAIEFFK